MDPRIRLLARAYAQDPTPARAETLARAVCGALPPLAGEGGPYVTVVRANACEISSGDHIILLSFGRPVALLHRPTGDAWQSATRWSLTTTRHVGGWLRAHGLDPRKVPEISDAAILEALAG